uniref:Uncharacterized protein n=1 Tax=Onchocerca volvulus TaxID=6282 RepID=A0A8R1Y8C2_ONCVO
MRSWLCFYFLALISVKECAGEKDENEMCTSTNDENFHICCDIISMRAEKRRREEFENNISTETVSKKANDAEHIHREYLKKDKKRGQKPRNIKTKFQLSTTENFMSSDQQRDLIIGTPDLST